MCRMVAKISASPTPATFELLTAPHSLQKQSECAALPDSVTACGPHNHGSGIAWMDHGLVRIEKTGSEDCWSSNFVSTVKQINTSAFIAHNRKASAGLAIQNSLSHPYTTTFQGDAIAFCHNGGVSEFMGEARRKGVTDSMLFMDQLTKRLQLLDISELQQVLQQCAKDWRYTSLNGLLLTKNTTFAWRCFDSESSRGPEFERYYTLFLRHKDGEACVASEPVDNADNWQPIPNRVVVALEHHEGFIFTRHMSF